MFRIFSVLLLSCLFGCSAAGNAEEQTGPRVIAIGDIHGDYDQFVKLLKTSGLVDKRLRWQGGETHLVQLGDIPDRGPDTRKAMDLLMKLEKAARKKGGAVTVLMGNHEMMNITDNLSYVHPGEYAAFKDRGSKKRRTAYYKQVVAHLKNALPEEEMPAFDDAWRKDWESKYPLGYVEHRIAWAPTGDYGKWAMKNPVVAIVGDSMFVHGGVSAAYSHMSVSDINTRVRTAIVNRELTETSILYDEEGPLWYRGWSRYKETPETDAALAKVLEAYGVKRMVVAHHPLLPVVLPRFGGKLVMVDVGLSAHYGNGFSALKIENGTTAALVGEDWFELPQGGDQAAVLAYLDQVKSVSANPARIERYEAAVTAPPPPREAAAEPGAEATAPKEAAAN